MGCNCRNKSNRNLRTIVPRNNITTIQNNRTRNEITAQSNPTAEGLSKEQRSKERQRREEIFRKMGRKI